MHMWGMIVANSEPRLSVLRALGVQKKTSLQVGLKLVEDLERQPRVRCTLYRWVGEQLDGFLCATQLSLSLLLSSACSQLLSLLPSSQLALSILVCLLA